jgi:SWI/SNF related-matrix-associated actin-dependent regulator of chromatin subfamily C
MWPPTSAVAAFAATPNPAPTVALASTTPASATTTGAADKVQSAPAVATTKIEPLPNVQTLSTKPAPQWEQHRPGPNDEMVTPVDQLTPKPSWYTKDGVADMERAMLPEWFDSSAPHRTPDSYIQVREKIILMSDTIANRNVTNSMIRRSVMGDAGSLQRLRNFLVNFGLINEDGINDSAPTPAVLRVQNTTTAPKRFSDEIQDELVRAVVQQSKRQKIDDSDKSEFSFVPIDWEQVAAQVGRGTTSIECERNFLSTPLNEDRAMGTTERSITPDGSHDTNKNAEAAADSGKQQKQSPSEESKEILLQELLRDLVEKTNPDIITKVTQTAMEVADNSLQQAQSAAQLGLMASRAVGEARTQENALASVLSQLVNQRMEKLENRMALLDDIEGIIEAEKVALELERRDLYTARCRHWFGGA